MEQKLAMAKGLHCQIEAQPDGPMSMTKDSRVTQCCVLMVVTITGVPNYRVVTVKQVVYCFLRDPSVKVQT